MTFGISFWYCFIVLVYFWVFLGDFGYFFVTLDSSLRFLILLLDFWYFSGTLRLSLGLLIFLCDFGSFLKILDIS